MGAWPAHDESRVNRRPARGTIRPMILSQIIAQTTTHQPVPIHVFTWENLLLFLKYTWLVSRALWPAWAFLAVCGAVKLVVMRVRHSR